MTIPQSLLGFALAALLLTLTPGLDTALVLRTGVVEGARAARRAALGITLGLLCWGATVALGLGAVLLSWPAALAALRWAGAAYLVTLGARMLIAPRRAFALGPGRNGPGPASDSLRRGLSTNLLNPKICIFYVSFLPQFVPAGIPAGAFMLVLAAIHAGLGLAWLLCLAAAAGRFRSLIGRPGIVAALDRATGGLFLAFGLRLALAPAG